ncbi:MAG: ribosomal protection-like ABC-F family protein [Candidatus Promineifilaceae bacterium]|jgi:ATP-binding cassette subfamily F protein 3
MSILTATNVGQSFGAYDVFSGVNIAVPDGGKIGLVGPNGVGKTTLLMILAGLSQPEMGQVHVARNARLGYLTQESSDAFSGLEHTVYEEMLVVFADLQEMAKQLQMMEDRMSSSPEAEELLEQYSALQQRFEFAGGYDYELQIKRVLTGLGFGDDTWNQPLEQLSGGQKTRALLARLLLEKPDLLIMDEPTNHLDVAAIEWLEGTLRTWDGAVLLVSHDRYFLDRVVDNIWEMSPRGIDLYRGNYSAYLQQRNDRWELKNKQFDALKESMAKEMDFIRRNIAGQRTQMAQGKLSRLAREVEAIHAGGLEVLPVLKSKGWLQVQNEFGLATRPASTVGELQDRINALRRPTKPVNLHLRINVGYRSGNIVLRTKDLEVGYPANSLFFAEDIELHRQECAGLIGPNGTGKTTFLRTILEELPPLGGTVELGASLQVGYFAQTREALQPQNSVLDEFLRYHPMPISEARNYLAQYLFRGDEVYNQVATLSGGEQARLALALLSLQGANFLLLDEPTNHLDLPAQETLQSALELFDGTILLVSHDRYLIDRLATQIWDLHDGRLKVYEGGYQNYLEQRDQELQLVKESKAEAEIASNGRSDQEQKGLSKNEQRLLAQRLEALEDQIHEKELQLAEVSEALQQASRLQEVDEIRRLSEAYAQTEAQLADLLDSWELAHQ